MIARACSTLESLVYGCVATTIGTCCPDCGAEGLAELDIRGGGQLRKCRACELVYFAGWEEGFQDELYEYHQERTKEPRAVLYDEINAGRQKELLRWLGDQVAGRRFLDVGCGQGQLVDTALREGWEPFGIDLAPGAIAVCQKMGLPCRQLDFFDGELSDERFDLIVMSELIEHVSQPGRFLRRAAELLLPGGVLYLTTPNYASLSRVLLGPCWTLAYPQHIVYFTPKTLSALVRKQTELEIAKIETKNVALASLANGLKLRVGGRARSPKAPGPTPRQVGRKGDRSLRAAVRRTPALRAMQRAVNVSLDMLDAGDTITALLKRPNR